MADGNDNDKAAIRRPRSSDFERLKACTLDITYQNSQSGSNFTFQESKGNSQLDMGTRTDTLSVDSASPVTTGSFEDIVAFVETDGRSTKFYIQDGRDEPGSFSAGYVEGKVVDGKLTVGAPSVDGHNVNKAAGAQMATNAEKMAKEIQSCMNSPSQQSIKKPVWGYKP